MVCKGMSSQFMPTTIYAPHDSKHPLCLSIIELTLNFDLTVERDQWKNFSAGMNTCYWDQINKQHTKRKKAKTDWERTSTCLIFCHASGINHFHMDHVRWYCRLFRLRDFQHKVFYISCTLFLYIEHLPQWMLGWRLWRIDTVNIQDKMIMTTSTKGKHKK